MGLLRILIPVSLPQSGAALTRLAHLLVGDNREGRVYALHLKSAPPNTRPIAAASTSRTTLQRRPWPRSWIEAKAHSIKAESISFMSSDVASGIAAAAVARQVDLVLMGFHKPIIGRTILGGTVHRVLGGCPADVAVFVDRGLDRPKRILVPYLGNDHDRMALELAFQLARNSQAQITVLHVVPPERRAGQPVLNARGAVDKVLPDAAARAAVTFRVVEDASPVDAVVREAAQADLLVIGVAEEWGARVASVRLACRADCRRVQQFDPDGAPLSASNGDLRLVEGHGPDDGQGRAAGLTDRACAPSCG